MNHYDRSIFSMIGSLGQRGAQQRGAQANASKRKQTQTNASKRKQTQRRKRKQTQANASKRGQTQTNAYTPLYCGFLHPPFAIPLIFCGDLLTPGHPECRKLTTSVFGSGSEHRSAAVSGETFDINFHQKRQFVHNSVCSQFLEGLLAILAECSQFCLRAF